MTQAKIKKGDLVRLDNQIYAVLGVTDTHLYLQDQHKNYTHVHRDRVRKLSTAEHKIKQALGLIKEK